MIDPIMRRLALLGKNLPWLVYSLIAFSVTGFLFLFYYWDDASVGKNLLKILIYTVLLCLGIAIRVACQRHEKSGDSI